jgi:hypothetical protein
VNAPVPDKPASLVHAEADATRLLRKRAAELAAWVVHFKLRDSQKAALTKDVREPLDGHLYIHSDWKDPRASPCHGGANVHDLARGP